MWLLLTCRPSGAVRKDRMCMVAATNIAPRWGLLHTSGVKVYRTPDAGEGINEQAAIVLLSFLLLILY